MFRRLTLCFLALLALPAASAGQADTSDVAVLTFGWPPGLEAHVTFERTQIRDTDGRVDTTATHITYRMSVEDHPAGRLVRYDNFSTSEIEPGIPVPGLTDLVGGFTPSLVIAESGELIELAEAERFAESVRMVLQPMIDSLPPETGGVRELVDRLLSPEYFSAKAAEEWNALVGTWVDAEFERGFVYELETNEPIPVFPDQTIPFLYQYSFTGRTRCSEEALDSACVVLEMVSLPDPDALAEFLDSFIGGVAGDSLGSTLVYRHLDVENYVVLITEPAGLIPHSLEISQVISGEAEVQGEGVSSFSQRRLRRFTYRY